MTIFIPDIIITLLGYVGTAVFSWLIGVCMGHIVGVRDTEERWSDAVGRKDRV